MPTVISTANYDTIVNHKDRSLPAMIPTSSSDSYPQQSLQRDQPNFPIEEFDDYSFAPILHTNSFECDDSTEVWYTPPTEEASMTGTGLECGASKSAPVPNLPKDLDLPNVSQSMPSTPSSLDAKKTRSKLKINLAFKLRGLKSCASGKGFSSMFGRETKKGSTSPESSISVISVQTNSVQMDSHSYTDLVHHSSSCSVTETEVTEFASNLTSKLVHEAYEVLNTNGNVDDSFDECHLNPFNNVGVDSITENSSNSDGVITMSCDVLEAIEKEVELVYNDSGESGIIMKTDRENAHNFEEDCDVYFTGGSLDTIHGACGEFTSSSDNSPNINSTSLKSLTNLTSPATMDTSGSISSFSSGSSTQSSTSGILKPPKRAAGYDPFGKNTDFTLPKRQVLFLENIDEVEMASVHLLSSRDTDSDDSTLSIEYAMRYFGCSSGLYSSSSSSGSDEDFLPVKN